MQNYDRLRRMACFMLAGDFGRADELVEDVLLTMFKSWGGIQDPQMHAVAVTARRIAQESAPRQRRFALLRRERSTEPAAVPAALVPGGRGDPPEPPDRLLPEQFARLTARQRVVTVLWWLYAWSQKDIAEALALRPRQVAREIQRVEAALRSAFGLAGMKAGVFDGVDTTGGLV